MKNKLIIILLIGVGVLLFFTLQKSQFFGAQYVTSSSYYGSTRASSSVPTVATTTNPVLSLDATRTNARICYLSGTSTVFLHQSNISTTTGVTLNTGTPLYPTSTQVQTCAEFPGFKGYLFAVTSGTVVLTTDYWK